jgi:hypothetical protein
LTNAGYPVFVYEMPEWNTQLEAAINTYQLFGASFNVLRYFS